MPQSSHAKRGKLLRSLLRPSCTLPLRYAEGLIGGSSFSAQNQSAEHWALVPIRKMIAFFDGSIVGTARYRSACVGPRPRRAYQYAPRSFLAAAWFVCQCAHLAVPRYSPRPCIHLASRHLAAYFEERAGVRAWLPPVAHGEGDDARRCEVQLNSIEFDASDIAFVRGAPLGPPLAWARK